MKTNSSSYYEMCSMQTLFVLDYHTLILAPHTHKTIVLTYLPIQFQKFLDQQVKAPSPFSFLTVAK